MFLHKVSLQPVFVCICVCISEGLGKSRRQIPSTYELIIKVYLILLSFSQAHEQQIGQLKQTLSSLPPLDTEGQLSDLLPYYYTVTELRLTAEALQVHTQHTVKAHTCTKTHTCPQTDTYV